MMNELTNELTMIDNEEVVMFPASYKQARQYFSPTVLPEFEVAQQQGLENWGLHRTRRIAPDIDPSAEKLVWPELPTLINGEPTLTADSITLSTEEKQTLRDGIAAINRDVLVAILRETDRFLVNDRHISAEDLDAWKTYRLRIRDLIRGGNLDQLSADDMPAIPFPVTLNNIPESPYL